MKRPKETVEEYDKRVWGNTKFILGFLAFIALQFFLTYHLLGGA